jgi:putative tryptophan/tyrosine transport system substrate-binding protein
MKRREFITLVAGAAASLPLGARAQQVAKLPTIGFLGPTAASAAARRMSVFIRRLQDHGWTDGRNIAIAYRWADGQTEQFAPLAAELVKLNVAVIVTFGTATALTARRATASIPIVFTVVADPVGIGLVASLARPGGNVTGTSTQHQDTVGKRLQLLQEFVPAMRRLAILTNVGNPADLAERTEAQQAADKLGFEFVPLEVRREEDIAPAITSLKGRAQALYVIADALFATNRERINQLAIAMRLPTVHGFREMAEAGGLISYGPDYLDLFRRAADQVDQILRGKAPADMPVEQPTKFELILNLKTAKALGVKVPPTLLATADEVIE